jgi:hypothetical protein
MTTIQTIQETLLTLHSLTFIYTRGAQAVHSAVCDDVCCCVCTRARDGTARPGM